MTNRREMLQMSVAATVLPFDAAWATQAQREGGTGASLPLYTALYDSRFAASRAFGERMAAQGVAAAAISGDMTGYWFDKLQPQWKHAPVAIAGFTARGPLFCLEQLAWDHGMRVVFRARHTSSAAGAVLHEIEGASGQVDALQRIGSRADWVGAVSEVIGHYPYPAGARVQARAHTALPSQPLPGDETLYSWVIAPVARS